MKPKSVLVAYPDDSQGRSLITFLRKKGFKIETANMVGDLIRKVRANDTQVILLDDEVEGVKACDLVSLIKKLNPKAQIIVASSEESVGILKRLRGAGIFYQAMKPLDPEEINSALQCAFEKINRENPGEGVFHFLIPKLVPA